MGAARQRFWPGLVGIVLLYRARIMAGLATQLSRQIGRSHSLHSSARIECAMVLALLRMARRSLGFRRSYRPLVIHFADDCAFLARESDRSDASGPVFSLGLIRIVPYFRRVEIEPSTTFLAGQNAAKAEQGAQSQRQHPSWLSDHAKPRSLRLTTSLKNHHLLPFVPASSLREVMRPEPNQAREPKSGLRLAAAHL
jgi:hypothetical protein